jgi:DNA polymerase-3 subunit alpha
MINRKVIESLIKAGAIDSLGWKRSQLFHLVDKMIEYAHELQKFRNSKQNLLFGQSQVSPPSVPQEVMNMPEWDESLFLSYEKDALGFYITGHPLAQYEKQIKALVSHSISELDENIDFNRDIQVAGIIASLKLIKTKKEERMATFILEDLSDRIEIVVFPDSYKRCYDQLREDVMVWVKGRYLGEGDSRRIHLLDIMAISEAFQNQAKRVIFRIFLPGIEKSVFEDLKSLLNESPGKCPVLFELETPHSYRMLVKSVEAPGIKPTEELLNKTRQLLGEKSVLVEY